MTAVCLTLFAMRECADDVCCLFEQNAGRYEDLCSYTYVDRPNAVIENVLVLRLPQKLYVHVVIFRPLLLFIAIRL